VFATSLLLVLAAAEATVRITRPQILERYPEGLYVGSSTRQYKMRPYFHGIFRYPEFETDVRINGQGLRENRDLRRSHPGCRRILALGDSFTMGYSVDEGATWVRALERLLNAERPCCEVVNAGVPGYSTWQELAYLEEDGLALAPDIVLLGFFIGNDIADNACAALPVVLRDGRLVSQEMNAGRLPLALRLALARHSHVYHLAQAACRPRGRYPLYAGGAEAGWRATAGLLDRMASLCRARRIRLIVVLIPERLQVEESLRRRLGAAFDASLPNRRMRELCRRAGVEAVDLLPVLAGPHLYFPQDGHWTARGNAAAARGVFAYLHQVSTHDPQ
jgi:hypothetical protein